ncbi:hypothetical protein BDV41DRAFT_547314 [Aspergillus transmontanensis]|uniref:Uncharacterized protein n=1 Tax=Aspergillus transmontanensis TaxID=1034304 RepID=A0A5N6VM40_9EURO|nr:hypothetical protein BDV41DRAFT_547314 [Aspergillus transmontanensis]
MYLATGSTGKALSVLMGVSWGASVSGERRDPEECSESHFDAGLGHSLEDGVTALLST